MQKEIIDEIISGVEEERERIEEPKNRSRYFIFGKISEEITNKGYSAIFENVPDPVYRNAEYRKESFFRVGDIYILGNFRKVKNSIEITFFNSEINKYEIQLENLKRITNLGIDYIMDTRQLVEYLLNFLIAKKGKSNSFISLLMSPIEINNIYDDRKEKLNEYKDLNPSQNSAIRKVLNQKVTFVWGPPGTGKTKTMAALADCLLSNGRTVLLSALSNLALDQLFIQTIQRLGEKTNRLLIARLGKNMSDDVKGFSKNAFERNQFRSFHNECIWREHVENSSLVGANLTYLTLPNIFMKKRFDYVIIDEVSMANIPSIIAASYYAKKGVVVGGDPHQLPPIFPEDAEKPNEWFSSNVFEKAGIESTDNPKAAFLDTQYRMQEKIGDLISEMFYEGKLKTGTKPMQGNPNRVIFIDSSGMVQQTEFDTNMQRRYNHHHAETISQIVQKLIKQILPQDSHISDVGIIAPYNAQVVQIHSLLKSISERKNLNLNNIKVSTVHSFQGQERKIIIFDITDSNIIPTTLTAKWQLINVSLSRAKEYLIVIGNRDYLQNKQYFNDTEISMFSKLLDHAKVVSFETLT